MSLADSSPPPPPLQAWIRNECEARWHALANCLGKDPSIFFPEDTVSNRPHLYDEARRICEACLVQVQCAEAGKHEQLGMWGGMSPSERHPKKVRLKLVLE